MSLKRLSVLAIAIALALFVVQCGPSPTPEATEEAGVPLFYAAFATPIEEPWDGVIHTALQEAADAGQIQYEWTDDIGYAGDMERVLREVAETKKPAAIFGDAFGNEEAVRRVAAEYPDIAFVFGSGLGPADPNLSVFDNWIHEPAYLCGLIAGGMTQSNVIGVVGGYPVPEVNRIINAFIYGVHEVNPDAEVLVTFINSWFDPPAAKEAALAQIDAGADILFAERFGVIEAAVEHDLYAFGNMSDQYELGPGHVLTGPVWDMRPTVQYIIQQIEAGSYTAMDLKDFSMMAKGGAYLAPFHGMDEKIPPDILELVQQREEEIKQGLFRVPIDENTPAGAQ